MVLLLAINTASVTVLPTGVIALRAAAGSADPAGILPTTLFATICSTAFAIILCKICARAWPMPVAAPAEAGDMKLPAATASADAPSHLGDPTDASASLTLAEGAASKSYPVWASVLALAAVVALVPLSLLYGRQMAPWLIPVLVTGLLTFGVVKRVRIYEVLVEGAREGFQVAVRIIPYLVAILVAVGMFRASGALEMLAQTIGVVTGPLGLPAEAVPMALIRSLSGSGAFGVLASLINDPAIGPDSYTGYLVSTIQGSSDTTLYIIAVYFGAVGVRRIRHALFVGLSADVCAVATSVFICSQLYGG
jgi:spore maturation protein SpmB